jgi:hypothetical protein
VMVVKRESVMGRRGLFIVLHLGLARCGSDAPTVPLKWTPPGANWKTGCSVARQSGP